MDDVLIEKILKDNSKSSGYVKCLIPKSDKTPHRAMLSDREYYKRSIEGFYRLEHFDLEDMFGRRQRPVLNLAVVIKHDVRDDISVNELNFYLTNEGRAVAKYYGFWCRFDDNMIIVSCAGSKIKDLSSINQGKPTISFENNIGVIHPSGIQLFLGSIKYKKKDEQKEVTADMRYYCDGMSPRALELIL